jgi:hypothetical protein
MVNAFGWIDALIGKAERLGWTGDRVLAYLSEQLELSDYDPETREAAYDHARRLVHGSKAFAPQRIPDGETDQAAGKLRDAARVARRQPAVATGIGTWPGPLAHELDQLLALMEQGAAPESAFLQLNDVYQQMVKLPAILLSVALGDDRAPARLMRPGLSFGAWIGVLRDTIDAAETEGLPAPLVPLARNVRRPRKRPAYLTAAESYVPIRNDLLGHGARMLRPVELADLVISCINGGSHRRLNGDLYTLQGLLPALEALVADGAFDGLTLVAGSAETAVPLAGATAVTDWLQDDAHGPDHHGGEALPIYARIAGGPDLQLAPYLVARACAHCNHRDLFLFDTLYEPKRGGRFDLLDYARGHKMRLTAARAPDLADLLWTVTPDDAKADPTEEGISRQAMLERLDKARIDVNYLTPDFMRAPIQAFLGQHASGVFWLRGPAHTGKSTLVAGLVGEGGITDDPIDPRFGGPGAGRIVAYHCRKEHRVGLGTMLATLFDKLTQAYDVQQNEYIHRPDPKTVTADPGPAAFMAWLGEWRAFAVRHRRFAEDHPLMVIIDGLDEAEDPETFRGADPSADDVSPIKVLPPPDRVPHHVYLLVTSRRLGEDGAPAFLQTHVAALYGDGPQDRSVGTDGRQP